VAKNSDAGRQWSHDLVRRIGATMKAARGSRSANWLSERTAELGYRVSPTVIAKLDSGHRGDVLSVAELLVLAAALDIAPTALLYGGPYEQETELLPVVKTTQLAAAQWFSGNLDGKPPVPSADSYQYRQNNKRLSASRRVLELQARKKALLSNMRDTDDQATLESLSDALAHVESDIERYREEATE
jgi:hypothetical protein